MKNVLIFVLFFVLITILFFIKPIVNAKVDDRFEWTTKPQPKILTGLFSQILDKTIVGTTVETSMLNLVFPTNVLIPDYYYSGKNEKYELWGLASKINGTATIRVKLNGILIMTTGAVNISSISNDPFKLEWEWTIRSIGSNGTIRGQGMFLNLNNGTVVDMPMVTDIVFNTTIEQTLDVTWEWSSSNPGNTVTTTNTTKFILN